MISLGGRLLTIDDRSESITELRRSAGCVCLCLCLCLCLLCVEISRGAVTAERKSYV
jgi:hypothetical protein